MHLKRHLPRLGLAFILFYSPLAPSAAWARISSLSNLFVFGDSLSDSGNSKAVSNGVTGGTITFPPAPYFDGRFSNGLVAAEYLWQAFNPDDTTFTSSLTGGSNYAIGGATTGLENFIEVWPITPSGLRGAYANKGNAWQLRNFYLDDPSFDPDTSLFMVWLFPNDVFYVNNTDPAQSVGTFDGINGAPILTPPDVATHLVDRAVANVMGTINSLSSDGARNFLVVNSPDLGLIPEYLDASQAEKDGLSALSAGFNASLSARIDALASVNPDLDIIYFELDRLFIDVRSDPGAFGFTNIEDRCLDGSTVCPNPDEYLFWDGSHPSTAGHALIGQRFFEAVAEPVPGPVPAAGPMVLLGWSRRLRRRIRQTDTATLQASAPKNQP
jgi:phospholipase/lecithinase/hemolysin